MHEGFVDVSEEGTAAAAATAIVVGVTSIGAQPAPLEVRADRPFLWAVIEQQTGGVLFAGLVRDPR
jgi:serpin B